MSIDRVEIALGHFHTQFNSLFAIKRVVFSVNYKFYDIEDFIANSKMDSYNQKEALQEAYFSCIITIVNVYNFIVVNNKLYFILI